MAMMLITQNSLSTDDSNDTNDDNVDGNDVDYLNTQLLAPVVKALDLVAEKSCGSQGWKFQLEKFGSSANTNLEDSGLKMGNF